MKNNLDKDAFNWNTVGLIVVIAILFFLLLAVLIGRHRGTPEHNYAYIDNEGNFGTAEYCAEKSGVYLCKRDGSTFPVNEFYLLVEGQ